VRGVLFDLYDTLVWTEWPRLRQRLADAVGLTPRQIMRGFIETREARGVGTFGSAEGDLAAVLRAAGASVTAERVRELAEIQNRTLLDGGIHVFDDTVPVLRELRARGIPTAVVSNCDHMTRPVVDALGLEDEADAVVLSFEVRSMKPDPEIFRVALGRIRADAEGSTFVDDQPGYLDGGRALGMRTLQIARPTDPTAPPRGTHPVIEDLWPAVPAD
jgi:HAD superfamily hydrolase (TIGR01509 family)